MTYLFGDVLLLTFPFSDASGSKRRPALTLLDTGDADVLVALISSHPARDNYDISLRDWQAAGLLLPSVIRIHKVATLEKSLILRSLGQVSEYDQKRVSQGLNSLWSKL